VEELKQNLNRQAVQSEDFPGKKQAGVAVYDYKKPLKSKELLQFL
jgi:hypothetical protein